MSRGVVVEVRRWHHEVLAFLDSVADPVLVVLALTTLPMAITATVHLGPGDRHALVVASWAVYGAFVANVVLRVLAARGRLSVLRSVGWDLVVVIGQPALALLHVGIGGIGGLGVPLVRVAVVTWRAVVRGGVFRRTWRQLVDHPLALLCAVVPFCWLLTASLVLKAESISSNGTITSIGGALWWGAATMSTVGYGDISPKTPTGRVIGGVTMIIGIGAFSVLTAKLAERLLAARDTSARAEVDLSGHTLIVGWSVKLATIVAELVEANRDRAEADIVVLCDRPRHDVERELHSGVPGLRKSSTTLIVRTGSPDDPADIARVSPATARAIVVAEDGTNPTAVVMAVLAILHGPHPPAADVPVIVEVHDHAAAESVRLAFGSRVVVVEPAELLARITVQSCRQPGLGLAYEQLLDFRGSELYVRELAKAVGRRFDDLQLAFLEVCPVGIVRADGGVELAPEGSRTVAAGERLVLLAVDDSLLDGWADVRDTPPEPDEPDGRLSHDPVALMMAGWNGLGPLIVTELDQSMPPGSSIIAVIDHDHCDPPENVTLTRCDFELHDVGGDDYAVEVSKVVKAGCDHAVVLSERRLPLKEADGRALLAALHVQRNTTERGPSTLVTELLDERDVHLARQATAGEFVVSDRLASLLMAQLAESPGLGPVFDQLLDAAGAELYSFPARWYAPIGREVSFAHIVAVASRRHEVAIGWRVDARARDADHGFGLVMNPEKHTTVTFADADRVLVMCDPDRAATARTHKGLPGSAAPVDEHANNPAASAR